MALAFKIKKAKYDALSDELKGEYIAGDKDGEFVLDVSDLPQGEDVGPVKRALETERNKVKTLKGEKDALQAQIDEFPDVAALKKTHETEVGKYKSFTESSLIDGEAAKLAAKISTAPALLIPHIKSRLIADTTGDKPVTKILDKDGKPSELTMEKLGQEFVANKDFAAIIIGSKASGGGAPRTPISPLGGGAPKDGNEGSKFDPNKANPKDFASRIAERKAARDAEAGAQ